MLEIFVSLSVVEDDKNFPSSPFDFAQADGSYKVFIAGSDMAEPVI